MVAPPPLPPTPASPAPHGCWDQHPGSVQATPSSLELENQAAQRDLQRLRRFWATWLLACLLWFATAFLLAFSLIDWLPNPDPVQAPNPATHAELLPILVMIMVGTSLAAGAIAAVTFVGLGTQGAHGLCRTLATLTCLAVPLGTALGLATLRLLDRPAIRRQFELPATPPPD
ncbi:MAG TPA: hypothetical protein VL860_08515 [Planctomycetota bacterium]|nr:hypothetical protein [Planctomycetota bacterium]